jgi:RNA polymerase sigma-B factor
MTSGDMTVPETDIDDLLREYRATSDRRIRNRIVETHLHLAEYHVKRYARGDLCSAEDLRQTALLAIIKAVERFDPAFGASFRTFASRTVEGELKRYLRDRTWAVKPPRRAQEFYLRLRRTSEELGHALGRAPTVRELAVELGVDEERVIEGFESGHARVADQIDPPPGPDGSTRGVENVLGAVDPVLAEVEVNIMLREAIESLDARAQQVIRLRFFEDRSQPEIAETIGVSQSYVSRILRETLLDLRGRMREVAPH